MAVDKTVQTSGAGAELTDGQVQETERMMAEMPRIDAALKTFLASRLAENQITGQMPQASATAAGAPTPAAVQGCARVFLKTLNALEPLSSVEWGQMKPQREDESGLEYLERLGQYKVVFALWSHCRSKGQKPAQMLGRSALKMMLQQITDRIYADPKASAESAKASEDLLREFVDRFAATATFEVPTAAAASIEDDAQAQPSKAQADAELAWALDYRSTLASRQSLRKEEAKERSQRAVSAEAFAEQVRSAVQVQETSSVQIVEIDK